MMISTSINHDDKHKYHLANKPLMLEKIDYEGHSTTNIRGLILCLLASWVKRYQVRSIDCGNLWSTTSTEQMILISSVVQILEPHIFFGKI
uniref:Uncharacterized protein n=1 Tax=Arundo donax TaxID=35708 RepID=A0A0A9B2W8_ARUDO